MYGVSTYIRNSMDLVKINKKQTRCFIYTISVLKLDANYHQCSSESQMKRVLETKKNLTVIKNY